MATNSQIVQTNNILIKYTVLQHQIEAEAFMETQLVLWTFA